MASSVEVHEGAIGENRSHFSQSCLSVTRIFRVDVILAFAIHPKLMRGVFAACVALMALLSLLAPVFGQVRIPKRPPGFTLGHGAASAGVQLEAYVDLVSAF